MKALGLNQPVALVAGGVAPVPAPTGTPAPPVAAVVPVVATPAGWYDDSQRHGHKRWWDGAAWGMRDDEHPSLATESPAAEPEIAIAAAAAAMPAQTPLVAAQSAPTAATATVAVAAAPVEPAPVATTSQAPDVPAGTPAARFCGNCGAERRPGTRFCTSCGSA
jgi:Protein of unknown function (DUF2510)/zinc-ribbon domain